MRSKRRQDDEVKQCGPLVVLIKPYIDALWEDVPTTVQCIVKARARLLAVVWNRESPAQRKKFATVLDIWEDPAYREKKYWEASTHELNKEELHHRQLASSNSNVPSEITWRRDALVTSTRRLRDLRALYRKPRFTVSDWDNLSDAMLATTLKKPQPANLKPPAAPMGEQTPANWRHRVQAEAWEYWLRLRASGCNPTPHSICEDMARWCIKKNIKGDKGQNPSGRTIRNTVLSAKHWTQPHHSVAEAKK